MFTGQVDVISNKETWISDFIQLVDEDDNVVNILNEDIGFDCTVYIKDDDGCLLVTGSIDDGKVVVSESDVEDEPGFQWQFEVSDLTNLCAGNYRCGVKTTSNGEVKDLILGTLAVLEGN